MKARTIAILFAFTICIAQVRALETAEAYMQSIINRAGISTDDEFERLLTGLKHSPSIVASEEFRALVKALAPFRMDLHPGLAIRNGRIVLYWFVGEFGVKKPVKDTFALFSDTLGRLGFTASTAKDGDSAALYEKKKADVTHRLILRGIERFIGSSTPSSGGSFTYEIEGAKETAFPLLREVLAAYPSLSCPRMIPELLELLNDVPVRNVGYGGTWTRYYDFDTDLVYKDDKTAKDAFSSAAKKAVSLGFSLDHEDRGVFTYMKEGSSGPILYLSVEEGGVFNFRIQPYT